MLIFYDESLDTLAIYYIGEDGNIFFDYYSIYNEAWVENVQSIFISLEKARDGFSRNKDVILIHEEL